MSHEVYYSDIGENIDYFIVNKQDKKLKKIIEEIGKEIPAYSLFKMLEYFREKNKHFFEEVYELLLNTNKNTPSDMLFEMCDFVKSAYYAVKLINHPNCNERILNKLLIDYNDDYDVLCEIASSKKATRNIFLKLLEKNNDVIKSLIAANPSCPIDIIEELAKEDNKKINEGLSQNVNAPFTLLVKLAKEGYSRASKILINNIKHNKYELSELKQLVDINDEINILIMNSKNCDKELFLSILSKKESYYAEHVVSSKYCPIELVLRVFSNTESFNKNIKTIFNPKREIDEKYYYFLIDYYIENYSKELKDVCEKIISNKILNGKPSSYFMIYLANIFNLSKYVNQKALKKVFDFVQLNNNSKIITIGKNKQLDEIIQLEIRKVIGFEKLGYRFDKKPIRGIDKLSLLPNEKDCLMKTSDEDTKYKLSIKISNYDEIQNYINGTNGKTLIYGEYPQSRVSMDLKWALDKAFKQRILEKTGISYRLPFSNLSTKQYPEYIIQGRKFIKFDKDTWLEVLPIEWKLNSETKCLESINTIVGIPKISSKRLAIFIEKELKDDISSANEYSDAKTPELPKERISSKKFTSLIDSSKKEEIEKEQQILDQKRKIIGLLEKCLKEGVNKKIDIPKNLLIIRVDSHYEINPEFLKYLKIINLGLLDTTNLKVSGIDFRGTNIRINPQTVYNKDLSNSIIEIDSIILSNYDNCITDGLKIVSDEDFEELLSDIEQTITDYEQMEYKERISKTSRRSSIPEEELIIKIDDHFEINPVYINSLRFIDLSLIKCDKLKVSGIDFRGTNIKINPQIVYNKDLSNSKFSDDNFIFANFEGCILTGTDISEETDSMGFDRAIINSETMLPGEKAKKMS